MSEWIQQPWPELFALAQIALAAFASSHVVLHKRDVRAAIGWVGLIWLVPLVGTTLYALFGINRIRRRAGALRGPQQPPLPAPADDDKVPSADDDKAPSAGDDKAPSAGDGAPAGGAEASDAWPLALDGIRTLMDAITPVDITAGNAVEPLVGGTKAYAEMIAAIDGARHSVALATYIFDADAAGQAFVRALAAAAERGVAVRVLLDGVGLRYSYPPISRRLADTGVVVGEFLPHSFPFHLPYANLRNHRKILIADGRIGFTGGMNIRFGHLDTAPASRAIQDVHFRLRGPVVAQIAQIFAEDWAFACGERLAGAAWFPPLTAKDGGGTVEARAIATGPDESFERVLCALVAALSQARRRVRVVTPYFLPDAVLTAQLMQSALRGVAVDIVVPRRNNLKLVRWASHAKLSHLLARGCRVWESQPPFDHSKLMTVDGHFALIGSANWDQRSLRLNFEMNVECYDRALAALLDRQIEAKMATARPLTKARLDSRPLPKKIRDGAAWLLSPYL
jgi:cardiolipin synthase